MMDIFSSCRVVVKFREAGAGVPAMTIGACMQQLLSGFPSISAGRLFASVPPNTIRAWVNKAIKSDPGYHAPDFTSFYTIGCTDEKQAEALAQQLSVHEAVELSYVENGFAHLAPGHPNGIPHNRQGYLLPAPEGINASYAWQLAGGQGEGRVRFIDIEQGWLPHHEAVTVNRLPCTGLNSSQAAGHGTAVLGILTLQPNQAGAIGIVPRAQGHVLSQWRPGGAFNTADAIMTAIGYLHEGDVLLIEAQTHHSATIAKTWPVEIHEASFQAIRLAVAMGIIVVEPAGNGSTDAPAGNDLDKFVDHNGHTVLNPMSDHFRDSGAIMVAAATHTVPHVRTGYSNYGRRVNCYAWGESVLTAGSHPRSSGIASNTYTNSFGGTSAAAAIVAGAAIALQSIAESGHRFRLNPRQMRSLLGDEDYGTPSAGGRWEDKIGVMPDLQKMISEALLIVPTLRSPGKLL
jgi:hypothetical protein